MGNATQKSREVLVLFPPLLTPLGWDSSVKETQLVCIASVTGDGASVKAFLLECGFAKQKMPFHCVVPRIYDLLELALCELGL